MKNLTVRRIIGFLLVISFFPGSVAAMAGINAGGCTFATFAAAVAAAGAGNDIWLQEGVVFVEGGITVPTSVQIRTGTAACLNPGAATPARAEIDGGGILGNIDIESGATVVMENINIRDHLDVQGGNLHVDGDLTLIDVGIVDGAANEGGGIFIADGASVEMIDGVDTTQVISNEAISGGGIYIADGGVLRQKSASIIWINVASSGGGVYNAGVYEMSNSARLSLNLATSNGGGIYVAEGALLDSPFLDPCTDCFFGGNHADGYGGAIFALDNVDLILTRFFSNNAGLSGGAIHAGGGGVLSLWEITMEENAAGGYGGGLNSWVETNLDSSMVIGNQAGESGGGIRLWANTASVWGTEFSANKATVNGGGISIGTDEENAVSVTLQGVLVDGNSADVNGGGLHIIGDAEVVSTNSRYLDNAAGSQGGGIMIDSDDVHVPVLTMDGPRDLEGCVDSPVVQPGFNRYCSELIGNSAEHGGGLAMRAGEAVVERTAFLENEASINELAIGLADEDAPHLTLRNVLVAKHDGPQQRIVHVGNATTLEAFSVTLADNVGTPVRYAPNANGVFARSIVWDVDDFVVVAPNSINATCSSFNGVIGATVGPRRVFFTNPIFFTTARGDYRLDSASPQIDQCGVGPLVDLDSDLRPAGPLAIFDRGAFEFQ